MLGEIRLSRNRRETLETSRETKISRIMREGSKKKKSIIGELLLRCLMMRSREDRKKLIGSGDSSKIRLRKTLQNNVKEMLREELLFRIEIKRRVLNLLDSIGKVLTETKWFNNSIKIQAIT